MRAKLVGRIRPPALDEIYSWARAQPLRHLTGSSYVGGRLEMWMGLASNLQSIPAGRAQVYMAPIAPWERLKSFGDHHLPGWNSILVCGGATDIDFHRDHGHFEAPVLMLNLGRAEFWEQDDPRDQLTREMMFLEDGDVALIDSKVLHRGHQLSAERFHVTWRTIRPKFLPPGMNPASK